jgi:hypothetical protein
VLFIATSILTAPEYPEDGGSRFPEVGTHLQYCFTYQKTWRDDIDRRHDGDFYMGCRDELLDLWRCGLSPYHVLHAELQLVL